MIAIAITPPEINTTARLSRFFVFLLAVVFLLATLKTVKDITAAGAVRIDGSSSTLTSTSEDRDQKNGLMQASGGWGITSVERIKTTEQDQVAALYRPSTVGSIAGNVNIHAGKEAVIAVSALSAGNDIRIDAERIELLAGVDQRDSTDTQRVTELGVTLALGAR